VSVVLRCPSCGTTRGTPGECEACGEAAVRYFCSNHSPGAWLDTPKCPKCGAVFGAPEPRPSGRAAPTRAAPTRAAPTRAAPTRAAPTPSARREPHAVLSRPRERLIRADEEARGAGGSAMAPWQRLLGAVIRARTLAVEAKSAHALPTVGRSAGGCLRRLVLVVALLFIALVVALVLFGRAVFHGFTAQ
jgi:hypothetical protein